MKKKFLTILLAAAMLCGTAGCGTNRDNTETGLTAEENTLAEQIQQDLQEYSAELTAEEAAAAGMYTIQDGAVVGGTESWDAFIEGETNTVVVCQFSRKGGAMLDAVERLEDGGYLVVTDVSRDGYTYEEKEDYSRKVYEYLTVFEDFSLEEGGTEHTVCVLSGEAKLTEEEFRTYWTELTMDEHGVYPLFVI